MVLSLPTISALIRRCSAGLWLLAAAGAVHGDDTPPLHLLGTTSLPYAYQIDGIAVGGISGLERNPQDGRWYLLSDDKSAEGPARFYVAEIDTGPAGPGPVRIVQTVALHTPSGGLYPPRPTAGQVGPPAETADAEALRRDPRSGALWWATEGDAAARVGPAVRQVGADGRAGPSWPLPPQFAFDPHQRHGPRPNLSTEGMSFDPAGRGLWVALEGPLHGDGPVSSESSGARVRLSLVDPAGRLLRQHAYRVQPLPPHNAQLAADNGVSEILAVDADHLLVLERAGLQLAGTHYTFRTRLFCTDLSRAANTRAMRALQGRAVTTAPKYLLFDLGRTEGLPRSNFEAMAWGPALADGSATLLLASDNNFDPEHATDFVLLASRGPLDAAWLRRYCGAGATPFDSVSPP